MRTQLAVEGVRDCPRKSRIRPSRKAVEPAEVEVGCGGVSWHQREPPKARLTSGS